MSNFFDKRGRDRVIHDWLKTNKKSFVRLYEHVLLKQKDHPELNDLILQVFEAGINFAQMDNARKALKE